MRRSLNAARVLQILDRIWDRDGTRMPADLRAAIEVRLSQPMPGDADGLAMLLSVLNAARPMGMSDATGRSEAVAERVLAAVRLLDDRVLLVDALSTLGPSVLAAGRRERAKELYDEAIALAGHAGAWHRPARDLVNLAVWHHIGPTPLDAVPWYEKAVEVAVRGADEANYAIALVNLGDVLMMDGQLRQASDALRRGLKAMTHMNRSERVARAILAEVLVRLDEPNSLEFAREAERDLTEFTRIDDSMADYLERLRITIAAAEQRSTRH
jgi:tetratricopeptide (TPR) repeat protein